MRRLIRWPRKYIKREWTSTRLYSVIQSPWIDTLFLIHPVLKIYFMGRILNFKKRILKHDRENKEWAWKKVDLSGLHALIFQPVGGSSSGRTAGSGSAYRGSNPCPPAKYLQFLSAMSFMDFQSRPSKVHQARGGEYSWIGIQRRLSGPILYLLTREVRFHARSLGQKIFRGG